MKKIVFIFLLTSLFVLWLIQTKSVPAQTTSFTFGATADFYIDSNFQATVNAVALENPDFLVALGDFSYTPGAELQWCNIWKAQYNNLILIVGNHDTNENPGGFIDNYVQYCPFPLTGLNGLYGHQFYFDYPQINPLMRVILIRPGIYGSGVIPYNSGNAGYAFTSAAIDDARANSIPWIVVAFHKNYINQLFTDSGCIRHQRLSDKKLRQKFRTPG